MYLNRNRSFLNLLILYKTRLTENLKNDVESAQLHSQVDFDVFFSGGKYTFDLW